MFSKFGTYPPAGMFSRAHITSVLVCLALIVTALMFSRKMTAKQYFVVLKVLTVLFTILEIVKIVFSIYEGQIFYETIIPLFFCSLFIYALWLTWFKNPNLKNAGLSFIVFACVVAGLVFIICPSTSFTAYPVFHFRCLYSMLFHSAMVYCGIAVFLTRAVKINIKLVFKYILFCLFFMSIALILNILLDANFMFLADPSGIPLPFLNDIYNYSNVVYTFIIVIAHLSLGFVVYGICQILELFGIKVMDDSDIVEEDCK